MFLSRQLTTTPHHTTRLGGFRDQNLENRNEGLAWPGSNIYLIFFWIEILKYCWLDVSWCLEAVLCLATGCALPLRDLLTASLELYNISLFPQIWAGWALNNNNNHPAHSQNYNKVGSALRIPRSSKSRKLWKQMFRLKLVWVCCLFGSVCCGCVSQETRD